MQSTPACQKKTYAGLEKGSGILLFLFLFISSNAEITIMTKILPVSVSSPLWSIVWIWEKQGLQEEAISFKRTHYIVGRGRKNEF